MGSSHRLPALPNSRRLRRSLVDGGAARGGAQQELPAGGGGGAAGDRGDSGGAGAAARPGLELPTLAWQLWEPTDSARAPAVAPVQPAELRTGLDGACLLLRDSCSRCPSGSRCPGGCPGGFWLCPGGVGGLRLAQTSSSAATSLCCAGPSAMPCREPLPRAACGERSPLRPPMPIVFATRFCTRFIQLFIY